MHANSIRYATAVAILTGWLLLAGITDALALRCGTQVVSVGDYKEEVRSDCGEPDHVEVWQEERIFRDFSTYRSDPLDRELGRNREPFLVKQQVVVERWTYNFGSHRLTRHLLFENGRLVELAVGEHGY